MINLYQISVPPPPSTPPSLPSPVPEPPKPVSEKDWAQDEEATHNLPAALKPAAKQGLTTTVPIDEPIQSDRWIEVVRSNGQELWFERDMDEERKDVIETDSAPPSNAQLMAMENASITFNIRERFWKAWLIDTVIQQGSDVQALKTTVEMAKLIHLISEEDQKAWFAKTTEDLEQDLIQYQPWDAAAAADFDVQQAYFDSKDYQQEDLTEACLMLDIPYNRDDTVFCMPGMALSQLLKFWQPVAVKALVEFSWNLYSRASFLADHVGLGKTWVIVCYLLHVSLFLLYCICVCPTARHLLQKPSAGACYIEALTEWRPSCKRSVRRLLRTYVIGLNLHSS